jgi:hypothetical protein
VACSQPGLSLLPASKNRSKNTGTVHTTTGKNRNPWSVTNRDQSGGASVPEGGLHAKEQRPEQTGGGKSEDQTENQKPKLSPGRRTQTIRDTGLTKTTTRRRRKGTRDQLLRSAGDAKKLKTRAAHTESKLKIFN